MIELSQRQYLALRLLREYQKPIPGQQFSQLLNVSPRTLRYEVKAINQIAGQPIILSSKEGYSLKNRRFFNRFRTAGWTMTNSWKNS